MKSKADVFRLALAALISARGRKRVLNCLWELTYRCNARCAICNYWKSPTDPRQELPLAEIRQGLKKIHAYGCRFVNFTGGEPTLRKDLEEIIRAASEMGFWTSVVTNGSQLNRERVRALQKAGLDNLLVSLDSTDPAIHDTQRGLPGLHAKVLECLGWLSEDFLTGHRTGGIMSVLSNRNLQQFRSLVELAETLGVYLVVQAYHENKTGDPSHKVTLDREAADRILRLKERSKVILSSRAYLQGMLAFCKGFRPPPCHAGSKYFSIDPYGFLHPCVDKPSVGHVLRDEISVIQSEEARKSVSDCQGCWYCFRGEADSAMPAGGLLERTQTLLSVIRQNALRQRHGPRPRFELSARWEH